MTTATKPRTTKRPSRKAAAPTPEVAASFSVRLRAAQIGNALRCAAIAASTDTSRPLLCAVNITRTDGGLQLVTTDSYRLHIIDMALPPDVRAAIPDGWSMNVDLDRTLLRWVLDICKGYGDVTCSVDSEAMTFTDGRRSVTMRKVEGDYVKWQGLVPTDHTVHAMTSIAFNPEFLSQIGAAAKALGAEPGDPLKCVSIVDPMKPVMFTVAAEMFDLKLTALLMPVRPL